MADPKHFRRPKGVPAPAPVQSGGAATVVAPPLAPGQSALRSISLVKSIALMPEANVGSL